VWPSNKDIPLFVGVPVIMSHRVYTTGPEGVSRPSLTSETSRSVRAVWGHVTRVNSDHPLTYQLQFHSTADTTVVEYVFFVLSESPAFTAYTTPV